MKFKSFYTICLLIFMFGCSKSEVKEKIVEIEEKYAYFLNEEVVVERAEGKTFTTIVRYDGKAFEGAIRIPYKITFPNSDAAIEGEDFVLPNGSGIFEIVEGNTSTTVTLVEEFSPNPEVTGRRSMVFELQSASGVKIGSEQNNSGTTLTVIIEPDS